MMRELLSGKQSFESLRGPQTYIVDHDGGVITCNDKVISLTERDALFAMKRPMDVWMEIAFSRDDTALTADQITFEAERVAAINKQQEEAAAKRKLAEKPSKLKQALSWLNPSPKLVDAPESPVIALQQEPEQVWSERTTTFQLDTYSGGINDAFERAVNNLNRKY